MSTLSNLPPSVFCELKRPPSLRWKQPKPIYFNDNNKHTILIPTNTFDTTNNPAGIWQYDLDQHQIIAKHQYPEDINSRRSDLIHCSFDAENKIFYMFGTEELPLASFNIKTKEWMRLLYHDRNDPVPYDIFVPYGHFIPSPINQLHLTHDNTHYKYDDINKVTKLSTNIGRACHYYEEDQEDVHARFVYCKQL